MARPFKIPSSSVKAQLTVKATAEKYGLSKQDVERVRLFVLKAKPTTPHVFRGKTKPASRRVIGVSRKSRGK